MGLSFIAGLFLGFAGSLHCVGMCGPIVAMMSGGFWSSLIYHMGRTLVYALLGMVLGWILPLSDLGATAQAVSLLFGGLFLVLSLCEWTGWFHFSRFTSGVSSQLMILFGTVYSKSGLGWRFFAGMLNGLLPCGLVYAALLASMAQGGKLGGPIFMLGFGLATLPALLLVGTFSNYLKSFLTSHRKNLLPLWLLIMGVIFLLRGLNLGIPYLSPKMDAVRMKGGHCCDK
jgi:sulfite exporter TauE/SafE